MERERGSVGRMVDKRVICQCYFLLAGSLVDLVVEGGPGTEWIV